MTKTKTAICKHVFDRRVCVKCGASIKAGLFGFKVCEPKIDCSYPTEIKEQPKVNYNKMTKAELIERLENSRTKSDYDLLYKCSEEIYEESGEIKKKNSALEKTNAEQAEAIVMNECSLRNAQLENKNLKDNLAGERRALKKMDAEFERQNENIIQLFSSTIRRKTGGSQ